MKFISIFVLVLSLNANSQVMSRVRDVSPAHSFGDRSELIERAQEVVRLLQINIDELRRKDLKNIRHSLGIIENSLSIGSEAPQNTFICLSNGRSGAQEWFKIYNRSTGNYVGNWTSKKSCLFTKGFLAHDSLTCLSNGRSDNREFFKVYDTSTGNYVGNWASKESCKTALTSR